MVLVDAFSNYLIASIVCAKLTAKLFQVVLTHIFKILVAYWLTYKMIAKSTTRKLRLAVNQNADGKFPPLEYLQTLSVFFFCVNENV